MKNFSVSIVVPVYNVEKYILDCLKSIVSQTYGGIMECVIVNDCSQDNSMEVVREFLAHYSGNIGFKIIEKLKNEGLAAARNTGIDNTSYGNILFVDSDDCLDCQAIERMISVKKKYSSAELIISGYTKVVNGYVEMVQTLNPDLEYINGRTSFINFYENGNIVMSAWNKLINKKWLLDNELYFEKGRVAEDDMWLFKALLLQPRIAYLHESTYMYRIRDNSITTKNDREHQQVWTDSLIGNNLEMLRLYKKKCNNPFMLRHVLWSRVEILKYVAKCKPCVTDFYRVCRELRKESLPFKELPLKHVLLNLSICYLSYIFSVICFFCCICQECIIILRRGFCNLLLSKALSK